MSDAEPMISRNSGFRPEGAAYVGSAAPIAPGMAIVPPQAHPGMRAGGETRRRTGLMPAAPRARFPLVIRDRPVTRVDPKRLGELRAALRRCEAGERAARTPWVESTNGGTNPAGDETLRVAYQKAVDLLGATRRELTDLEAAAKGRPTQVRQIEARDPSAVAHAFDAGYDPPVFVCLHDRCQGDEWPDEGAMRRAHPSDAEMAANGAAHVFGLRSEAPMDPADPDGERVGLIAPIGADGSTIASVAAGGDSSVSRGEVEDLRAQIDELRALLAAKDAPDAAKRGRKAD